MRGQDMPDGNELGSNGYVAVFRSDKFEIWHQPEKGRVYVMLLQPLSPQEVELAVQRAERLGHSQMDLITDHSLMPGLDQVEDTDLSVCLDEFFDKFRIRNIVRICEARENCGLCVPLDSKLSTEEKGRLLGRVYSFKDANKLLDHQHGAPGL